MYKTAWLRQIHRRYFGPRPAALRRRTSPARGVVRPCLEELEDRITPTTFAPTTFADDGSSGSLRGAITAANNDTGSDSDTIQLSAGTYTLSIANTAGHETGNNSGDLNIIAANHPVIIQGVTDADGKPATIIDQTVLDRVFQIDSADVEAQDVTFKDVVIEGGTAEDDGSANAAPGSTNAEGGGILDDGDDFSNLTLDNVVVQNNSAQASAGRNAYGGGIYSAGLTLISSVVATNKATAGDNNSTSSNGNAYGGGIYVFVTLNDVTLTSSTVEDNTATGGSNNSGSEGGSAYGGGISSNYNLILSSTVVKGNRAQGGDKNSGTDGGYAYGGGIEAIGGMTLTSCTVTSNTAQAGDNNSGYEGSEAHGGGIYGGVTLTSSTVSDNTAAGGNNDTATSYYGAQGAASGGGLDASYATITMTSSSVTGNTVKGGSGSTGGGNAYGGGFDAYNVIGSSFTVSGNSVVAGDGSPTGWAGAAEGGGGYLYGSGSKTVNSTIAENTVLGANVGVFNSTTVTEGGGLYLDFSASLALTSATVAENSVNAGTSGQGDIEGGGIYSSNTGNAGPLASLTNSLVAGNTAPIGPDVDGTFTDGGHNLIGNTSGSSGFTGSGDKLNVTANIGQLADNGGPTQTIALLSGSPAIDAGDNTATSVTGSYDQRGPDFTRVFNGTIDIGALEVQPPPTTSAPTITSGNSVTFVVGRVGNFLVTATGSPTPTLSESGALPSGVTFADNGNGTATLGGTPAANTPATYHFTITAHNGIGSDATQDFTLTVNPPSSPPPPPASPPTPRSSPPPPPAPVSPIDQIFIEVEQLVAQIEAEIIQLIDAELSFLSNLTGSL